MYWIMQFLFCSVDVNYQDSFMTSAEHFISLITVTSAKKLATALVICFIIYHGVIHLIYGMTKVTFFI